MEKYGVEHFTQAKEIKERIVSSNINKYGGIGFSSPELMEKQHKTMMEKYNSYHNMLVPELKEKCFDSIRRKHGGLGNASTELKEKQHQTMLERYGDIYPEQIHEINLLFKRKYKYNGIFFDSLSEIAYYKKLSETGAKFTYHPKIRYDYTYNGKRHYYFPDFEVDGKVIEIKGTHFFTSNDLSDPNTQMINPYNRKYDGLANAKFNCMKEHDVEIILVEPTSNVKIRVLNLLRNWLLLIPKYRYKYLPVAHAAPDSVETERIAVVGLGQHPGLPVGHLVSGRDGTSG